MGLLLDQGGRSDGMGWKPAGPSHPGPLPLGEGEGQTNGWRRFSLAPAERERPQYWIWRQGSRIAAQGPLNYKFAMHTIAIRWTLTGRRF
jgi:hypothetical protein